MPRSSTEQRSGPRYLASFLIRAEWDDAGGKHYVAEGVTENVGPEGALVHIPRDLPDVGSRVSLHVLGEHGEKLRVITEVLRLERNAAHPLAALQLLDAQDEWRGLIWEPAATQMLKGDEDYEEDEYTH